MQDATRVEVRRQKWPEPTVTGHSDGLGTQVPPICSARVLHEVASKKMQCGGIASVRTQNGGAASWWPASKPHPSNAAIAGARRDRCVRGTRAALVFAFVMRSSLKFNK